MKEKFLKQASRTYSPRQRYLMLVFLAPIFLLGLPWLFIWLGGIVDRWLQLPAILPQPFNLVAGILLILPGWGFALWSIYSQFTIGRGTPVPLMATRQLVIQPPYTYCRNPMALGTIVMYLGVAFLFHSIGAAILVLIFSTCLLLYIKFLEEKEMEARFGGEYRAYRQRTPFLVPSFRNQHQDMP